MSINHITSKLARPSINMIQLRQYYYKFERKFTPPTQKPKESPYIVGPHLKPDYLEPEYITEPLKHRHPEEFDYNIYIPTKIEPDESRTVRLLLTDDVEGLGVAGSIVDVNYRFGASKLIAMKKAEYATDFALKWYKFGPRTVQSASTALSPRTVRLLKASIHKLPVKRTAVLQPWHMALALRLAGFKCPLEAIEKDSITSFVDNEEQFVKCYVKINNHERVEVKFSYAPLIEEEDDIVDQ